jgi:hypothetical protein
MWSGALGYSVIRDDWKSALQFRKKEKRTRKMPEGFQTTSFPRKRRRIRADLIQAEIDSILSFLYSIKTSKIKIKRGGTVIEQKLSHTACGWWSTISGLPKKDPLRNPTRRVSTNQQTNTHTVGVDFEGGGSYRIWLNCVDKRNGQFEGVVSLLGGRREDPPLGPLRRGKKNKKVQTARSREKNGAKRTKDKENDRSESEIINSGSSS